MWMYSKIELAAHRYKIQINYTRLNTDQLYFLAPKSRGGCDVQRRILYIDPFYQGPTDPVAIALHELSHIVGYVPGVDTPATGDQLVVPEQYFLLQFEDALAKSLGIALDGIDAYRRLADIYHVPPKANKWEDFPNPRETTWWQEGVARSVVLGLTDSLGWVTWQNPIWTPEITAYLSLKVNEVKSNTWDYYR